MLLFKEDDFPPLHLRNPRGDPFKRFTSHLAYDNHPPENVENDEEESLLTCILKVCTEIAEVYGNGKSFLDNLPKYIEIAKPLIRKFLGSSL